MRSSVLGGNSNSCARDLAASSATFAARSRAMLHGRIALVRCSILYCGFAIKSSASARIEANNGEVSAPEFVPQPRLVSRFQVR